MSLLTICQNAAKEVGFSAPSTIVGNTDQTAMQLFRLANKEGEILSRDDWQILKKEETFTLVTSTQTYDLPSDFRYIIPSTTWNRDNRRMVINPLTSEEWQFLKGWTQIQGLNLRARIRNNKLEFEQTITSADNGKTIAYEYISDYWAQTSGGTAQAKFQADSDTALLDEELITQGVVWRFEKAKGLDFQANYIDYMNLKKKILARDGGSRKLFFGEGEFTGKLGINLPDRGYG